VKRGIAPERAGRYTGKKMLCKTRSAIVAILVLAGCASTDGVRTYELKSTLTGVTGEAMATADKINGGNTFEVYFSLEKPEDCVKVFMETSIIEPTIKGNKYVPSSAYFIVERKYGIEQFGLTEKSVNTEIGRNFDLSWTPKPDIELCTRKGDPIMKMAPGLFRVRFTSFRSEHVLYTLDIYTNKSKVTFR